MGACPSRSCSPIAFLARPERWLWTHPPAPRHALRRPELRLRAVRAQGPGRGARGTRPVVLALRAERRGAGEPRHPGALRRAASLRTASGARPCCRSTASRRTPSRSASPQWAAGRRSTTSPAVPSRTKDARSRPRRTTARPCASCRWEAPLPEHEVRIVDEGGKEVAERVVGRLVFRGPSMTRRLLQEAGGHRRDDPRRRLARQRRPRLPRGGRDLHRGPQEGPDHQGGPQPGAPGDRGGRGHGGGNPQGLRGGVRSGPSQPSGPRACWWWPRPGRPTPLRASAWWRR